MRLVDADALEDALRDAKDYVIWDSDADRNSGIEDCISVLDAAPTIRCDGCEKYKDNHTDIPTGWCKWHDSGMYPNDGCVRYQPGGEVVSELGKLQEEYRAARLRSPSLHQYAVVQTALDYIAALEAELERKVQMIVDWHASDKKHIAELEAELTEFRAAVSGHDLKAVNTRLVNDNLGLRDEIEKVEATIESLSAEKAREKQRRIQAEAALKAKTEEFEECKRRRERDAVRRRRARRGV